MRIEEAIYQLNPTVVRTRGDVAYDANGNEVAYDLTAAQALVDANAYKASRASEYPAIGDQLDALFHAGVFPAEMAAAIQAVKDKYPKGSGQ
jgi:hypothetical protein